MARWPLIEVVHAFQMKVRESAGRTYRHEMIVWALTAPHSKKKLKPPTPPGILRED